MNIVEGGSRIFAIRLWSTNYTLPRVQNFVRRNWAHLQQHCVHFLSHTEVIFRKLHSWRLADHDMCAINGTDDSRKSISLLVVIRHFLLPITIGPENMLPKQILCDNAQHFLNTGEITWLRDAELVRQKAVFAFVCHKVQQHEDLLLQVNLWPSSTYKNMHYHRNLGRQHGNLQIVEQRCRLYYHVVCRMAQSLPPKLEPWKPSYEKTPPIAVHCSSPDHWQNPFVLLSPHEHW